MRSVLQLVLTFAIIQSSLVLAVTDVASVGLTKEEVKTARRSSVEEMKPEEEAKKDGRSMKSSEKEGKKDPMAVSPDVI